MNTLTFYIVRFAAPLLGFVLLLAVDEPAGLRWLDLACIAIAVAILVGGAAGRPQRPAGRRGWAPSSGRMARKVRRSVDPDAWVRRAWTSACEISARFRYGFVRSLLGLCGMLAADLHGPGAVLRFVGVSAPEVALVYVAIAYLFAYPFTLFPFSGLGIVDALVLAARGRGRRARGRGGRRRCPGRVAGLHGGGADRDGSGCRHRVAPRMARRRPARGGIARLSLRTEDSAEGQVSAPALSRDRPRVYVARNGAAVGSRPGREPAMPRRRRHTALDRRRRRRRRCRGGGPAARRCPGRQATPSRPRSSSSSSTR